MARAIALLMWVKWVIGPHKQKFQAHLFDGRLTLTPEVRGCAIHRRDTRRHLSAGADLTICCVGGDEMSAKATYAQSEESATTSMRAMDWRCECTTELTVPYIDGFSAAAPMNELVTFWPPTQQSPTCVCRTTRS